jgi:hypothetical protein
VHPVAEALEHVVRVHGHALLRQIVSVGETRFTLTDDGNASANQAKS